ncbi:MAG: hypothetical protein KAS66_09805 [Candidatus Omnitrophica bacterium]|nr:hypothetical protein [Candidatus Omnitrophota bacterium]
MKKKKIQRYLKNRVINRYIRYVHLYREQGYTRFFLVKVYGDISRDKLLTMVNKKYPGGCFQYLTPNNYISDQSDANGDLVWNYFKRIKIRRLL